MYMMNIWQDPIRFEVYLFKILLRLRLMPKVFLFLRRLILSNPAVLFNRKIQVRTLQNDRPYFRQNE
jgi:hypothetical protein